jgi:NADH:ubiquinone oxidoreductase subunit D
VRKHIPYDAYDQVEFEVPIGQKGDVYDRYRCRMEEFRQSNKIIRQCINNLPRGPIMAPDAPKVVLPPKDKVISEKGLLPLHLGIIRKGPAAPPDGEIYSAVEVPKGELGFYIVSDGSGIPYRLRLRSPSFVHASILPRLSIGHLIADVIANIGTIDIVLGECDR